MNNPLHLSLFALKNSTNLDKIEITKKLVVRTANINALNSSSLSALYLAVQAGNIEIVTMLLTRNIEINQQTKDGHTPLMRAIASNNIVLTNLLLAHGADCNIANRRGGTALFQAAFLNLIPHITALLDSGARVEAIAPVKKDVLLGMIENKSNHIKDNIINFFNNIGKEEAALDACAIARLMGHEEAAKLIESRQVE